MIHSSAGDTEVNVPTHLQSVCDAIGKGDVHDAVQKLQEIPEAAKAINQTTMDRISQECSELCSERCGSNFKSTEKEKLKVGLLCVLVAYFTEWPYSLAVLYLKSFTGEPHYKEIVGTIFFSRNFNKFL